MYFGNISASPALLLRIKEAQEKDETLQKQRNRVLKGELPEYTMGSDGIMRFRDRVFIPKDEMIKKEILKEAHCSRYTVHPGNNKMYRDLKQKYY